MCTVHQSTLCPYISEKKANAKFNPTQIQIWTQVEECLPIKETLNHTSNIGDLKKVALREQDGRHLYQAYYRGQQLGPGERVPSDTKNDQPVILRKIIKHQPPESRGKLLLSVHITAKAIVKFIGSSSVPRGVVNPSMPKPVR